MRNRYLQPTALLLACLLLLASLSIAVPASTAGLTADEQSEIQALRDKQAELDAQIAAANEQIHILKDDIDNRQAYANELTVQLDNLKAQISVLNESIAAYQADIDLLSEQIEANTVVLRVLDEDKYYYRQLGVDLVQKQDDTLAKLLKRLRYHYMTGESTKVEALFESGSIYVFLLRMELMNGIAAHDAALIDTYRASMEGAKEAERAYQNKADEQQLVIDRLAADAAAVEVQQNEIVAARAKLQTTMDEQDALFMEVMNHINALDKESERYEQLVQEYNEKRESFDAEIDALIAEYSAKNNTVIYSGSGFVHPLSQYSDVYISSGYGGRSDPITGVYKTHYATDFCSRSGTANKNVVAAAAGTVVTAATHSMYGNYVLIDHGDGIYTLYAHNNSLRVSEGQSVVQGEVIALAGATGYTTGAHVHFEVRVNGEKVDPMGYVSL